MARVTWSPQALADLQAIGDRLADDSPVYAQAFVDGAFDAVKRLELFPRSGRAVPEIGDRAMRELIYRGHRIFHLVSGDGGDEEVDILSVFHASRAFGGGSSRPFD